MESVLILKYTLIITIILSVISCIVVDYTNIPYLIKEQIYRITRNTVFVISVIILIGVVVLNLIK